MRIAVCDDEKYFRDCISDMITDIYKEDIDIVIRTFDSGLDFLKHYIDGENSNAYDLIILDVEMGKINYYILKLKIKIFLYIQIRIFIWKKQLGIF